MPPISPQGSRTGLVTALVIFVILFVTTAILYIYENAERRSLQDRASELELRQSTLVTEAAMSSAEVTKLMDDAKGSGSTAIEAALRQRKDLAKTITGQELPPDRVESQVRTVMAGISADLERSNVKLANNTNLIAALQAVSGRVVSLQRERDDLAQQLTNAKNETQQTIAARDAALKQKDEEIARITEQAQTAMQEVAAYRQQNTSRVQAITTTTTNALSQQQQAYTTLQGQLAQATETITTLNRRIEQLQRALKIIRVDPNQATITKPDGEIVRLPGRDLAVINLGIGDQLVPGMTFEVFDRATGIPTLPAEETVAGEPEKMPAGKASLQVVRIQPNYTECRVIRRSPGQQLVQGDIVANLVYDPTQKYSFVVYGAFDLDGDKRATPGDADIIKRLITQWGGGVMNGVNINTDFLVMGAEPQAEGIEEDDDAVERQRKLEAQQALEQYLAVRKQAVDLNIPILNQNRFLNLVGYRSEAVR